MPYFSAKAGRRSCVLAAVLICVPLTLQAQPVDCPEELCPPTDQCWDPVLQRDRCVPVPEGCTPSDAPAFEFTDDGDNAKDGQLWARSDTQPHQGCGTVTVDVTGYYSIFDTELSESCNSQLDESGYVTITNSCNAAGFPENGNVGPRYIVTDNDNGGAHNSCSSDAQCGAGQACSPVSGCCVPDEPTFMGTFLLVADEPNTICLNHWCPEYLEEVARGNDPGFVFSECVGSPNSIHLRLDNAIVCEDVVTGDCRPHPGGPGGPGSGADGGAADGGMTGTNRGGPGSGGGCTIAPRGVSNPGGWMILLLAAALLRVRKEP